MYSQIPDTRQPLLPSHGSGDIFQIVPPLLARFQQSIKDLSSLIDQLSIDTTGQVQEKIVDTKKIISQYSSEIHRCLEQPVDPAKKGRHAKLAQSYQDLLVQYQKVAEVGLKKEKQLLSQVKQRRETKKLNQSFNTPNPTSSDPFAWTQTQQQQQQQQQQEFSFDQLGLQEEDVDGQLIREYNTAIQSTEQELLALKETFQDVHQLVGEQAEILNEVEDNIIDSEQKAQQATDELRQANVYRQSSRTKYMIVTCILLVVLIVIILLILFVTKTIP